MTMISQSTGLLVSVKGIDFDSSDQTLEFENGFQSNHPLLDQFDPNFALCPPNSSSQRGSSSPCYDSDEIVLKYINQVLMEEELGEKPCMFHDALALQAAEKSFYDVIGEKYPTSPDQPPLGSDRSLDSPDSLGFSDSNGNGGWSVSSTNSLSDTHLNGDFIEDGIKSSWLQTPVPSNFVFQSTKSLSSNFSNNFANGCEFVAGSSLSWFNDGELALQFQRGEDEANELLARSNRLLVGFGNGVSSPKPVAKFERGELFKTLTRKKSHDREDDDLEDVRSNKQPAVYLDENIEELSHVFDKVLLCQDQPSSCSTNKGDETKPNGSFIQGKSQGHASNTVKSQGKGFNGVKLWAKKSSQQTEVIDLRTLLTSCAQAISDDEYSRATEILRQIRQHSSPTGDGFQRLAHYFANSLEARLAGTGTQIYTGLSSKKTSAVDMLKGFQAYMLAIPFKTIALGFAYANIIKLAEQVTTLHIIDFGISYGFQWPALIQGLSGRDGGPPKIRITGIDLPQSGFRPAEGVIQTGKRLASYCERFGVPFEYIAIAKKWETITIDDLKINPGHEFIVVNCICRFRNLLDETVLTASPRNAVLNLIRKINPNIFIKSIVNGSYNAPFFMTRFREALFHFSTIFDMCDTNMGRDDPMRLMFEKEFYGREIMSVVACEGSERVERPETYKQWQARNTRAGFKMLPLDREIMQKLRSKVEGAYSKDFILVEEGNWLLQGFKGRIVYASSAWVPA